MSSHFQPSSTHQKPSGSSGLEQEGVVGSSHVYDLRSHSSQQHGKEGASGHDAAGRGGHVKDQPRDEKGHFVSEHHEGMGAPSVVHSGGKGSELAGLSASHKSSSAVHEESGAGGKSSVSHHGGSHDRPRDEHGRFVCEEDLDVQSGQGSGGQKSAGSHLSGLKPESDSVGRKSSGSGSGQGAGHRVSSGHPQERNVEDQPRDEHGRFISLHQTDQSSERQSSGKEHESAREKLAEAAREFAMERGRDEQGRFLSEEKAGVNKPKDLESQRAA